MISRYVCEKSTFEEVRDFWEEGLWPNRKTAIEPLNAIVYNRYILETYGNVCISKDWTIFDWSEPTFFVMKEEETKMVSLVSLLPVSFSWLARECSERCFPL